MKPRLYVVPSHREPSVLSRVPSRICRALCLLGQGLAAVCSSLDVIVRWLGRRPILALVAMFALWAVWQGWWHEPPPRAATSREEVRKEDDKPKLSGKLPGGKIGDRPGMKEGYRPPPVKPKDKPKERAE